MSDITAILTAYRRPQNLRRQFEAIRSQVTSAKQVWLWANQPTPEMMAEIDVLPFDRVVICRDNAYVHARFALAMLASSGYVAVFDDDALPGCQWFTNCLRVMNDTPGILGSAGVRLQSNDYGQRELYGWHTPSDHVIEVDLVGHAWFLRTSWVQYLFVVPAVVGTNGEDIELAARAWRTAGIRSYCPPHPPGNHELWGSTRGVELGSDPVAMSRRSSHLAERDAVVRAEIAAGWKPLFARERSMSPVTSDGSPSLPAELTTSSRIPSLLEMVPVSATNILELGCGEGDFGAVLRRRQQVHVVRCDSWPRHASVAHRGPDEVLAANWESSLAALDGQHFDCIVFHHPEKCRNALWMLRRLRELLGTNGRLLAVFPNVRHLPLVNSLLEGSWDCAPSGPVPPDQLRFFTRREIEKAFFRAGFSLESLTAAPGPDHKSWSERGRPSVVEANNLTINCTSSTEAEEFYASHFLVSAKVEPEKQYGLTSIVILTLNQLEFTRRCIDSVRHFTDEPYELIVVDNGSTDGTADYLRCQSQVRLIANRDNRGFPAGVNQGIRAAIGQQILLLNNDTIVTSGWLRRLLDALHSDPAIGLVGPCSNRVSGEQQVPVNYDTLGDLDGFAWDRGKAHARALRETDRLVGFCLLMRRELVDRIGDLDERFGIGCFEDDDYCRRALQAGYRAVIALDSFVHHFGGQTFVASGVDFAALMRRNQQLFDEKWGSAEVAAGRDRIGCDTEFSIRSAPAGGLMLVRPTPRLSLCMITRDNTRTIEACIKSIRPWVDEMIVVDTGSKDNTPQIVQGLGARLYHFPWCDSFSAARNESLKYARGQWIFWMDSDDVIDDENGRKLRELAYSACDPSILGYVMQVHCPGGTAAEHDVTVVDHIKLFRNHPGLRFEGRIHEQILPAIRRAGGEAAWTDVFVVHAGYDHSPAGQEAKKKRDLHLLHLEFAEQPHHPFTLFNLGMTYADIGEQSRAVDFLNRSIQLSTNGESHVRKAYALQVYCYMKLGDRQAAWDICQVALNHFPQDAELRFRKALLLQELGRLEESAMAYRDVLEVSGPRHFSSIDLGIQSFKARQNLAIVYMEMGELALAEEEWRRITHEVPSYRAGWRGLGEAILRQGNLKEAATIAELIIDEPRLRCDGLILKSQIMLANNDPAAALQELNQAVREFPGDADACESWCRVLFDYGTESDAEKGLQDLLRIMPDDASAYHNLGTIYLRSGRFGEAADAYRESLRLRPKSAGTLRLLARVLGESCQLSEAISVWKEVRDLVPNDSEATNALAQLSRASPKAAVSQRND